ncbi:MAG: phage tail tape measure protein [archaeon]|nr:phage tail tape measure protein [archaeon]
MATATKDLTLELTLDSKGAVTGFRGIDGALQKFDKATKKAKSSMSGMWKQMAIGMGATQLITSGFRKVTQAIISSITAIVEFEEEFANVTTLLNAAADDPAILNLRDGILDLVGELGNAKDLTKGLYQAISAGRTPANALEFIEKAAKFAQGSLTDMAGSVDLLTTVLNAYQLSAEKTTDVSDVLFETIKQGKTTGPELAQSLGMVIPSAAQLNINLREVGAAMATMTKFGIDTATATTSLNAVMMSILKPTKQALAVAKEYRIELSKEGIAAAGGFQKWLIKVKEAMKGNETEMAVLAGNLRSARAMFTLAGKGAEEYTRIFERMNDKTIIAGNTQRAFEKQQATFGATMTALKNKIEGIFIKSFLPMFQQMAVWLKQNSESIVGFFKGVIETGKIVVETIKKITGVLITLGKHALSHIVAIVKWRQKTDEAVKSAIRLGNLTGKMWNRWKNQSEFEKKIRAEAMSLAIKQINLDIENGKKVENRDQAIILLQQKIFKMRMAHHEKETDNFEEMIWQNEQWNEQFKNSADTFQEETEKNIELTDEQKEAIKKQEEAFESLNKTMGILTNKGYKELKKKSNSLNVIWKYNKNMILGNAELTKKWKKEIEGINKEIEIGGRVIPQSNLKIIKSIDGQNESYKELNNMVGKTLPISTVNLTDDIIALTIAKAKAKAETKKLIEAEKKEKEEKEKLIKVYKEFKKQLDEDTDSVIDIIDSLVDLGFISGKTGESLMEAAGGVNDVLTNLARPIDDTFTKFDKFRGVAHGAATALGGIIGGSEKTKQALQGLASGVSDLYQGISTGNPFKIIAGGFKTISNFFKLFKKDHVGNAIKSQNAWMKITKEQTEALRELEKEVAGVHEATSLMLDDLMEGNVTLKNSDKWLNRIREVWIGVERNTLSANEGVEAINKSFKVWIEQAKELGTTGSKEFFTLVNDMKNNGVEIVEINNFVMESFMKGLESYKKLQKAMTGDEEISEEMEKLNKEMDDLVDELENAKEGTEEYLRITEKISEVTNELDILEGKLSDITDIQEIFGGISIGVYDDIIDMENRVAENPALFNAIESMNNLLMEFSNTTVLTEQQFDEFGESSVSAFDKLIEKGFSSEEALSAIAPTLKRLEFLQKEFGYSVEEGTAALIEEADQLGLLKSDPFDRMAEGIEGMTSTMQEFIGLLAKKMGIVTESTDEAVNGIDKVGRSIGGLERRIKDFRGDLRIETGGGIPGFAKGTDWIKAPGLFTLGEEGPEKVDYNNGRMRVTPQGNSGNTNNNNQKVVVNVDGSMNVTIQGGSNMTKEELEKTMAEFYRSGRNELAEKTAKAIEPYLNRASA